jgi:hypothetical protein
MSASFDFLMIWQYGHGCPLRIPPALCFGGCGFPHCRIMENAKGLRQGHFEKKATPLNEYEKFDLTLI